VIFFLYCDFNLPFRVANNAIRICVLSGHLYVQLSMGSDILLILKVGLFVFLLN
jgi:hypothetical protein